MTPSPDHHADNSGDDLFAAINVTPFVDVMLVLLVVFMVVAPMMVRGIPIDLPSGAGHALGHPAKPMIVSIARDGSVYVGEDRIPQPELGKQLSARPRPGPDTLVYLRADRQVPYGDVVSVIGELAQHGYARVSLLGRSTLER